MEDLSLFDIKRYLDDNQIKYAESGKNIGRGWIGVDCPVCGDTRNHFGISLTNKSYSCWACGTKGNPFTFIRLINGFSNSKEDSRKIHQIIRQYSTVDAIYVPDARAEKLIMPDLFLPLMETYTAQIAIGFLQLRGFDPIESAQKYQLMWGNLVGDFKWRLIIPIFQNGELVNFTGRTVANQSPKYKSCPNAKTNVGINETLYGIEEADEGVVLVVVEGVFDQWRLGKNSVAMYGLNLSDTQTNLLRGKNPSKIIFLYDQDVLDDREKYNSTYRSMEKIWFCPVEVITLETGDPGDLSLKKAGEVMKCLSEG